MTRNITGEYFRAVMDANKEIEIFLNIMYPSMQNDSTKRAIAYYGHILVRQIRETIADDNAKEAKSIEELTNKLRAIC